MSQAERRLLYLIASMVVKRAFHFGLTVYETDVIKNAIEDCHFSADPIWDLSPASHQSRAARYGYCPSCGLAGINRERRPNGDDRCPQGHVYASATALTKPPPEDERLGRATGKTNNIYCPVHWEVTQTGSIPACPHRETCSAAQRCLDDPLTPAGRARADAGRNGYSGTM